MNSTLISLYFLICINVLGQTTPIDTNSYIPKIDTLKKSLHKFYEEKTAAEQSEYNYKIKHKWLRYLPTLGINLFPLTPLLGINSSNLSNQLILADQKTAKVQTIIRINKIQYEEDIRQIITHINNLNKKITFYNFQLTILSLYTLKFEISNKSYQSHEITPTEFLNKQIEYNTFIANVKNLELDIQNLKNHILLISRHLKL